VVVPKHIREALESGETTVEDVRALLEVEAMSQDWSLEQALAWARSGQPPKNYIQVDIRALAYILDLCSVVA
jgi:hypothetical protein